MTSSIGIDDVVAEVLPQDKGNQVIQQQGQFVAMAGDGINGARALAQAQIGIAMGTGTDAAMESAGVTLVKGDLRGIVRARLLSRATMRNIKENLFFAFVYNSLGVPITAGALYPAFECGSELDGDGPTHIVAGSASRPGSRGLHENEHR